MAVSDFESFGFHTYSGLRSNQGEKCIDFYFMLVPLRNRSNKTKYSSMVLQNPKIRNKFELASVQVDS